MAEQSEKIGRVKPLGPGDVDQAALLLTRIVPHVGESNWKAVLSCRFGEQPDTIGFGLYADDELVGFMATIFSVRKIRGKDETFCNLHSVFVHARHAASAPFMLLKAMDYPHLTLTAMTPSKRVGQILRRARFNPLEVRYRLFPPLLNIGSAWRFRARIVAVTGDEPWLTDADATLLRDHARHRCRGYALIANGEYTLIITQRNRLRKPSMLHVSDCLHVGNAELFSAYFERAKLAILCHDRTVLLRVDERLLGKQPRFGIKRERTSYFLGTAVSADEIDNLYSEMVFNDLLFRPS